MASNTYGAIKLTTAEDVGAVLKKKTGSADGYKPKEWADTINLMGLLPVRTASGSIAHFTDGADAVPLKSLTAQILPIQEGTGTPSPSNPRPISGTSVLNVKKAGKNLNGFTLADFQSGLVVGNARFIGIKIPRSTITYSSNAPTGNVWVARDYTDITTANNRVFSGSPVTYDNVEWLCIGLQKDNMETAFAYLTQAELGNSATDYTPYSGTTTPAPLNRTIYGGSAEVVEGTGSETDTVIDLGSLTWTKQTMQNGSGFTARIEDGNPIGNVNSSGALCENYPEDTSVQNAYYINDKTFKYGGTYFGRRNITILDSDLSSLSAADFKTAMSGVKLYYPLETPSSFTFDGVRVESLEGVNNVWTDSGDVTVEYRADINLLISELGG